MAGKNSIGQAYITILPETESFGSTLKNEVNQSSDISSSGEKSGSSFVSGFTKTLGKVAVAATAAVATGAVALSKAVIENYATYEQLSEGAKLMYGDAYDYIAEQAQSAYKTVQMSQNDYLEQVNGFATGLKTALGGNEQQAAELANKIVTAEADVVAATGASQEAVSNAFNGIMRSNYTMLDNLQLGIKPTKEGFQEVIDKVNEWNAANGEATSYQIDNLADCQAALVDYIEMQGLAGYAASEGAETISGSIATLKASWTNFLTGLGDSNADMSKLTAQLVESFENVVDNIMPVINNIIEALPEACNAILKELPALFDSLLPSVVTAFENIIQTLADMLPGIASTVAEILPSLIDAFVSVVKSLASNLDQIFGPIIEALPDVISSLIDGIIDCLPQLIAGIGTLVGKLVAALPSILIKLVEAIPEILKALWDGVKEGISNMFFEIFESDDVKNASEKAKGIISDISEATDALNRSLETNADTYSQSTEKAEANAAVVKTLWGNLLELVDSEDQSAGKKALIKQYVEELNELLPGLGLQYDEITGKLNKTNTEMDKYIERLILEAQVSSSKNYYESAIETQYTATKNASDALEGLITIFGEYGIEVSSAEEAQAALNEQHAALLEFGKKNMIKVLTEALAEYTEAENVATEATEQVAYAEELYTNAIEAAAAVTATATETIAAQYLEVFGTEIPENLRLALAEAEEAGVEIPESLVAGIMDGSISVEEAAQKLADLSVPKASVVVDEHTEVGASWAQAEADGMLGEEQQVIDAASTVAQSAVDATEISEETGANGAEAMDAMIDNIDGKMASLSTSFSGIVLKASEKLGAQSQFQANLKVYGQKIPTLMADGCTAMMGTLQGAISSLVSGVQSAIDPLQSYMQNAGYWAGQGLANGLYSMWSYVYSAAASLASAAKQGAYITLSIHSPSKVFQEIGQFVGEGFAIGINDNADMVTDAMDNITSDIKQGASEIADEMNNTTLGVLGGNMNYESEVRSTISGTVDTAVNMGSKGDTVINYLKIMAERIDRLSKMQMVTDTGVLAGELAPAINNEFASMARLEARR